MQNKNLKENLGAYILGAYIFIKSISVFELRKERYSGVGGIFLYAVV